MDKMDEFLGNFTKILLAEQRDHFYIDGNKCRCGHEVKDVSDWEGHVADVQARQLVSYLWDK